MNRPFLKTAALLLMAVPGAAATAQPKAPHGATQPRVTAKQEPTKTFNTIDLIAIGGLGAGTLIGFSRAGIFRPGHVAGNKIKFENYG